MSDHQRFAHVSERDVICETCEYFSPYLFQATHTKKITAHTHIMRCFKQSSL